MKLALDAAAFVRDRRGMGRVARGLLRSLARDDTFEITLLAAGADARALATEFPASRIAPPASAKRRGAYDVVWYPFNALRFEAAAPSVVTIYDAFAFTEPHPEFVARMREQKPIARAAKRAARIVTISAWSRSEIVRELRLSPGAITVIATPPDAYFFPDPGDPVPLPPPLDADRFALVVGATEARKNVRLALDACAAALTGPHETLVIAGQLSTRDRSYARELGLRCGEMLPGDEMLRALYRKATVVLVPSRAEGFGLVAAEALACGAAVIASAAAALPEATRGAAILLPPEGVAPWAQAIRALLDEPERLARQRALARATFADSGSEAYYARYRAVLREAAGDRA